MRPERIAELDREASKDVIRTAVRAARMRLRRNEMDITRQSVLDAVRRQLARWCPDIPSEQIEEVVAEAMAVPAEAAPPAGRPAG